MLIELKQMVEEYETDILEYSDDEEEYSDDEEILNVEFSTMKQKYIMKIWVVVVEMVKKNICLEMKDQTYQTIKVR